ncbi:acyltransferase family protein [Mobilicoccus massiliensis]|uniref:acyltransferase family protein n=1 Tax=Mobilicoccus massiliensis TaxID=1522310 RepID=UPI001596C4FC|nr:acyltransferase family protein [Mobilicoccus massiliensis]
MEPRKALKTRRSRDSRLARLESFGRPSPRPGSTSASRLDWIDAARGLAIVAVVLLHVSIGHYYALPQAESWVVPRWDRINQVVSVIRMPLLFVVSGMLAAGKIKRGFLGGNAILSIVTNYYLYLVWLAVYGFLFVVSGPVVVPFQPARVEDFFIQIVQPRTPLWFVFGLAGYTLVFTALRRVPSGVILAATAAITVWSGMTWTVESPLWTRIFLYVFYFAVGVHAKRVIVREARSWWYLLVSGVLTVAFFQTLGLVTLMTPRPLAFGDSVVSLLLQLAASVFGITASAQLCRWKPWSAVATWIGRRTLGIYVMHVPVIVAVHFAVELGPLAVVEQLTARSLWFDLLYPVGLTAFVIVVCVWIEKLLGMVRLGHLFRLPSRYRRRLYRR